ncbi:hypothetical protein TNCV_1992131 [Trichonephila clavipes]|nr:hypothetical protein TNCV_1992131 [Trichonephila clavipes]
MLHFYFVEESEDLLEVLSTESEDRLFAFTDDLMKADDVHVYPTPLWSSIRLFGHCQQKFTHGWRSENDSE